MFDHVYPTGSPELDEQRDTFARYLDTFAGGFTRTSPGG
jgi:pyruvate dehydrogenase E1 component alpha subunit